MRTLLVCLCVSLSAQMAPSPQDPGSALTSRYWQARTTGQYAEAASIRQQAREMLDRLDPTEPTWSSLAVTVPGLYENAGFPEQARNIALASLAKAEQAGLSNVQVNLLNLIASSWINDRNPLKAIDPLLKAMRVPAAPQTASQTFARSPAVSARFQMRVGNFSRGPMGGAPYQQLAMLYRQLGQPSKAEALVRQYVEDPSVSRMERAAIYQNQLGKPDEAAVLLREQVDEASAKAGASAWEVVNPLQALAGLYLQQQRYSEAASVLREAIAAASRSSSNSPVMPAIQLQQQLAHALHQAGKTPEADALMADIYSKNQNAQTVSAYAQHLVQTKRPDAAAQLLTEFQASHTDLSVGERTQILYMRSNAESAANRQERATELQQQAQELAMSQSPQQNQNQPLSMDLGKASTALNLGRPEDAYRLALECLARAASAPDRESLAYTMPGIAFGLQQRKMPEQAQELFQALLRETQSWALDSPTPAILAQQSYVGFLQASMETHAEVPAAIDRLRQSIVDARGASTGWLDRVYELAIQFHRNKPDIPRALELTEERLKFEESLSGATSEAYMNVVEQSAGIFEQAQDTARTLSLRRQAVTISDLVSNPPNSFRSISSRSSLAYTLARLQQFDEAETVMREALEIESRTKTPHANAQRTLDEIRKMRQQTPQAAAKQ